MYLQWFSMLTNMSFSMSNADMKNPNISWTSSMTKFTNYIYNWNRVMIYEVKRVKHHNKLEHDSIQPRWCVNPVINHTFRTESWWYPDLDARSCGGTQPVSVGTEAERVDDMTAVQRVQMLAFVQIPEHGLSVLNTDTQRTSNHHPNGKVI